MMYSEFKRRLFLVGIEEIQEINPLTFNVMREHDIGGISIFDVENSETELLIAQDSGDPFIYDLELK